MADIKFSQFPSTSSTAPGDSVVGLHSGVNEQFLLSSTPTASALVIWDANKNLSANNLLPGYTTTATAAATTVLTVASTQLQYFTGTTTQTVTLPVTSTLVLGQSFTIVNNSTGVVTVQSSGGNTLQAMAANSQLVVTCILTSGTGVASWNASYSSDSGAVSSITGTADQVLVNGTSGSAQTGDVTLTLPQNIATSSSPTFTGLTAGNINLLLNTISTTNTNGNLFVNPNGTGRTVFDSDTEFASSVSVQVASVSSNADLAIGTFSATGSNASIYYMYKSASTTVGSFSPVASGDIIGLITARGDDGAAFQNSSSIAFNVQGSVSAGIVPGQITFSTVNTSGALTQAMAISNAQIVTLNNPLPVGSGGLGIATTPSNGQIPIGNGTNYVAATITAGTGVSVTNGSGSITIAANGNGSWVDQTTASASMVTNTGYTSDAGASLVTFTLPTTSAVGDYVEIVYKGSGGWTIIQGTGQSIRYGIQTTTTTTGSLSSNAVGDCVRLRCSTANTLWTVVSVIGNLTYV